MEIKSGFAKENLETYLKEGIEYCKSNHRMVYNSEFHDNHGLPWEEEDLAYMVQMRPSMKWKDLCLALGRTQNVCMHRYHKLKKLGKLEYYKNLQID
ncbi:MAG: hypothetical protein RR756_06185 [Cetobacterium sp.]